MDLFWSVVNFVKANGAILAVAVSWLGFYWLAYRRRNAWESRNFRDQIVFSINYVVEGKIEMRTLREVAAREVWLNEYGVEQVLKAAELTTLTQPFVVLKDPKDQYFVHQAVMNAISEQFAEGFLAYSMGLPVLMQTYYFAVTFERDVDMRSLKLRVLIVRREDLETHFNDQSAEGQAVIAPTQNYLIRLRALQQMSSIHLGRGGPENYHLGRVVLVLRQ